MINNNSRYRCNRLKVWWFIMKTKYKKAVEHCIMACGQRQTCPFIIRQGKIWRNKKCYAAALRCFAGIWLVRLFSQRFTGWKISSMPASPVLITFPPCFTMLKYFSALRVFSTARIIKAAKTATAIILQIIVCVIFIVFKITTQSYAPGNNKKNFG